jgi:hypothetical protein
LWSLFFPLYGLFQGAGFPQRFDDSGYTFIFEDERPGCLFSLEKAFSVLDQAGLVLLASLAGMESVTGDSVSSGYRMLLLDVVMATSP